MNNAALRPVYYLLTLFLFACDNHSSLSGREEATHELIFEGYLTPMPELLVYNTTGNVERFLAQETVVMDPQPSPDGRRIVFVIADYEQFIGDIYVMNRDGTNVLQLTKANELDDQPTWSPDGKRIAFRSFREGRLGDIWVMDANGDNPVNLTPDELPGVSDENRPAWSPDGTRIAYASNVAGTFDIWTMAVDGSDKRQITDSEDLDSEPAWSPDNQSLVFRRGSLSFGSNLYIISLSGGSEVAISLPGLQRMPVWSVDGTYLVFVNQLSLNDRPDIFRMDPDGQNVVPLVTHNVAEGSINPAFLKRQ